MNEQEYRREMRRKKKRAKKIRNILMIVMAFLIVILGICAFFLVKKNAQDNQDAKRAENNQETVTGEEQESPDDASQAEADEPEPEPQPEMLEFTEEEKYTGDLILVNYQYPYHFDVNESLVELVNIKEAQSVTYAVNREDMQLASRIMSSMDAMIDACNTALGVTDTGITSAYRTQEYQQQIYEDYKTEYGEDYAKAYVANPGYSEHHTGLAADLGIYYADGSEGSFTGSNNASWMEENCYNYGFVRRYRESKAEITKTNNESWHFRYVGVPHATYMYQNNLCLEEYIDYLRSNTSQEQPLSVTCSDGSIYQIFFTNQTSIEKPEKEYLVSGNNVDGYIITVKQ